MRQAVARRSDGIVVHIEPYNRVAGKVMDARDDATVLAEVAAREGVAEADLAIAALSESDYRALRRIGGERQVDIGEGDAMSNFRLSTAARRQQLKDHATRKGLLFANTNTNPLTGQPISASSDPTEIRLDTFRAYSLMDAAYPTADAPTQAAIDASRAEKVRLAQVTIAIWGDIEAGAITSEAQIDDDSRWQP